MEDPAQPRQLLAVCTGRSGLDSILPGNWTVRNATPPEALKTGVSGSLFSVDAILLSGSGEDAAALCNDLARSWPDVPIIVASRAFEYPAHRAACLRAGASAILPADPHPDELAAQLDRIPQRTPGGVTPNPPARGPMFDAAPGLDFQTMAEALPGLVFMHDAQGNHSFVNREFCAFAARSAESLLGHGYDDLVHPEDRARCENEWRDAVSRGEPFSGEMRFRHHSGAWRWQLIRTVPVRSGDGPTAHWIGTAMDITDHREAEERLRRSEKTLRSFYDSSSFLMGIVELPEDDSDIFHVFDNATTERFFGMAPGATSGKSARQLGVPDQVLKPWIARYRESEALGRAVQFEYEHGSGKDSSWLSVSVSKVADQNEGRTRFSYVARDISAAKRAEAGLQESEERLAAALDAGRLGVFDYNPLTQGLAWDARSKNIWGVSEGDVTTRVFEENIHPADHDAVQAAVARAFDPASDGRYMAEYRIRHGSDGSERWIHAEGNVSFAAGRPVRFVGTMQDITARKRDEETLKEQQRLYRTVTDNATLGLFIMDERQQCIFMNPAAERLTGFTLDELKGRPLHDYIHHTHPDGTPYPLSECPIDQAFPKNDRESGEEVFVHRDGHFYDVRFTASPIPGSDGAPKGTVVEVEDISERKRTERRIQLLMREVNHRSKNMLAVVQAIATQTAAKSSAENFIASFRDRLQSLAASHDLLVSNDWSGVALKDLVASQLRHFTGQHQNRISFGGPPINLTPTAAQALGMALHELATNAGKYGALSAAEGRVHLSWKATGAGKAARFSMCWEESGGPPVAEPRRRGFGSRLIAEMTQMSLGGEVKLQFNEPGLVWTLDAPLDRLTASNDAATLRAG